MSEDHDICTWDVKRWRAQEHLNRLQFDADLFCAGGPGDLAQKLDAEAGEYALIVKSVRAVPPQLVAGIGDCVQNLRSALDHIVWRVAEVDLGREPPSTTEFPIFRDPKRYAKDFERKLGAARPDLKAFFERLQPYNRGYEDLGVLHELSRRDKHRTLLVAASVMSGAIVRFRSTVRDFTQNLPEGPLVADTELVRYPASLIDETGPGEYVDMDLHIPTHIAFNQPGTSTAPVIPTLSRLLMLVRNTLALVEREAGARILSTARYPP